MTLEHCINYDQDLDPAEACSIPDCTHLAYKTGLCYEHWQDEVAYAADQKHDQMKIEKHFPEGA